MGCFSQTCIISRLPIGAGDDVLWFPIVRPIYDAHKWSVFAPPILGTYDDYGRVENIQTPKPVVDIVVNAIREQVICLPAGDNKYHEYAVTDTGSIEDYIDLATQGRMVLSDKDTQEQKKNDPYRRAFSYALVRLDVWKELFNTFRYGWYSSTDGRGQATVEEVLEAMQAGIERVVNVEHEDFFPPYRIRDTFVGTSVPFEGKESCLLFCCTKLDCRWNKPLGKYLKEVYKGHRLAPEDEKVLLTLFAELTVAEHALCDSRVVWQSSANFDGTQVPEWKGSIDFYKAMLKVAKAAKKADDKFRKGLE